MKTLLIAFSILLLQSVQADVVKCRFGTDSERRPFVTIYGLGNVEWDYINGHPLTHGQWIKQEIVYFETHKARNAGLDKCERLAHRWEISSEPHIHRFFATQVPVARNAKTGDTHRAGIISHEWSDQIDYIAGQIASDL